MVNALRYGAPFHNEYASLGARFVVPTTGFLGLLASPARGLAWTFPAIWLVPLGLRHLWRLEDRRSGAGALGGFSFVLLLVTGSWHSWFGDVCWGPRFMVSALPLLAVAADLRVAVHEPRLCEELGRPARDRHRVVPRGGADGLARANCVLRSALRIERVGVAGQGVTSQWVERPGRRASAQWHYGKRASTASRTSSYANSSSSASPSSSVVRW